MTKNDLVAGQKIRHYKGEDYEVIGRAHHTETGESVVLYKPLYSVPDLELLYSEGVIFARPETMFFDKVNYNGSTQPRFSTVV